MIVSVNDPAIEFHDLTVSYDQRPVLWDIDCTLPQESLIGIVGPNGAGKSTLIKTAMGLIPPASGYVRVFGKEISEVQRKVSYVPQRESVDWDFPASVMDVVLMGRYKAGNLLKRLTSNDRKFAMDCLVKVGLQDFAKRQISQLSGGQQQRVFIARSLAQEAEIYLMDEPFAGVDAATEQQIFDLLVSMKNNGKTIVIVHHDLQTAFKYFDWFVFLNTRLVASGPKDDVFTSELLQETYGGKLTVLASVGHLLEKKELPIRGE